MSKHEEEDEVVKSSQLQQDYPQLENSSSTARR
jgi:hypothetical protein